MKAKESMVLERPKRYEVSAINVVTHPHSPELYVELFKEILVSQEVVKVHGLTALMLGSCKEFFDSEGSLCGLQGVIFKFLKLDADEPWFDTLHNKPAETTDIKDIVIPEHLKPHLEMYEYIFFPKEHKLLFVSKINGKRLSEKFLNDYLTRVTQSPKFAKYETINFTVIPEINILEQFFSLKRLKKISYKISRPNPDDLEAVEEAVLRKLQKQNISEFTTVIKEASSAGIDPDDKTRQLMEVATHNGEVKATGHNINGEIVELSTIQHPLREKETWRKGAESLIQSLISSAPRILNAIMKR